MLGSRFTNIPNTSDPVFRDLRLDLNHSIFDYTSKPTLINLLFQSSTQIWMDVLGSLSWGLEASFVLLLHNAEFFCFF